MRIGPKSVRARLTLWYTISLSVPLIAFAIVSYMIFAGTLRSRTDSFIRNALAVFIREVGFERSTLPSMEAAVAATVHEVRFRDLDIVVLARNGRVIALSSPLNDRDARVRHALPDDSAALLPLLRASARAGRGEATISSGRLTYRVVVQPLNEADPGVAVAGIYPLLEVQSTLERIRQLFMTAIPLLIAIAAAGGYLLARRSLAPVSTMAARAADISATTLHERLPIGAEDELGSLARVLNDLLDRLESSFAQQQRFMTDASHELRTPAAILRAEADVTLSREHRTEDEYRDSMGVVQDAARRLTRIVDDIFLIARADAGHVVMHRADLALEDTVHDAVRALRPIADRRGVRLDLGDVVEAPFHGDPDLIGRVLLNLIDNAIKHSSRDGSVSVELERNGHHYEIAVIDDGEGIPDDAHARVFERFFRIDPARSRADTAQTSGAGLGLAIARTIAELHGGSLDLAGSRPGHTEFRLRLPAPAPGPPAA